MGRPLKLDPALKDRLMVNLEAGLPYTVACAAAGLSYRTFRRYMVRGERSRRGRFRQFWQDVQDAELRAQARLLVNWQNAAKEDWRAAARYAARRWPKELGHLDPVRDNGRNGHGNGHGNGNGSAAGPGATDGSDRVVIQVLSAIPRPERPTVPPLTLSERMASKTASEAIAGNPAPPAEPAP